jgi:non-specific serine/threonine protein kinase
VSDDFTNIKHFYISEEQSIYLLSHKDAQRQRAWEKLCQLQLKKLGYSDIKMIGKGAFGFAFSGIANDDSSIVFKFSRMTLPEHVQDRLEDEGYMQSRILAPQIPKYQDFQRVGAQRVLMMDLAPGLDLDRWLLEYGSPEPRVVVKIATQLARLIQVLRQHEESGAPKPIVHGDIKPSNVVFDPLNETVQLIDWGSSVFAQLDSGGQPVGGSVLDLMSGDVNQTNSRLGDVYFIGKEQMSGKQSSPRFDEQGLAATIYAIAANMPCRFGSHVVTPQSIGLPIEFAQILTNLLSDSLELQRKAGDYLLANISRMDHWVMPKSEVETPTSIVPVWTHDNDVAIDTVVYSSRKSFLRQHNVDEHLASISDAQLDRYYKNYLTGMGDKEKGLLATVSRLGQYPIVGGLAIHWDETGHVSIDSSLNLYEPSMRRSFIQVVNNLVILARSIRKPGIFKACMFNARDTIHIERADSAQPFVAGADDRLGYVVSAVVLENDNLEHSYFEDGEDPDELLKLPVEIMNEIMALNTIHHTGVIIFEALDNHLKIHNYYRLLDPTREAEFSQHLERLLAAVPLITGLGISGFMKLPFKNTRHFECQDKAGEHFYPTNPLAAAARSSSDDN